MMQRNIFSVPALLSGFSPKQRNSVKLCLVTGVACLLCATGSAQTEKKNLLGFVVGGELIPSNSLANPAATNRSIDYSSSLSLELNYGRRLFTLRHQAVWLDVPALVGPNHRITSSSASLPTSNATFYVTPSARLAFTQHGPVSPWVSAGFGYGLYETSDFLQGGANNPTIHTHTGVAQFGAGVDVKTPLKLFFPIGLRGEFRDFYALNAPTYFVPVTGSTQNNYTLGGGAFIRW